MAMHGTPRKREGPSGGYIFVFTHPTRSMATALEGSFHSLSDAYKTRPLSSPLCASASRRLTFSLTFPKTAAYNGGVGFHSMLSNLFCIIWGHRFFFRRRGGEVHTVTVMLPDGTSYEIIQPDFRWVVFPCCARCGAPSEGVKLLSEIEG